MTPYTVDATQNFDGLDDAGDHAAVVVDMGDRSLSAQELQQVFTFHTSRVLNGQAVHYAARRPATRGSLIVAAHRAGDATCIVVASPSSAVRAVEAHAHRLQDALLVFDQPDIQPNLSAPTTGHQFLGNAFDWMGRLQHGYSVPFIAQVLSTFGMKGMFGLFPLLQDAETAINGHYGETLGHVVTAMTAMGNGCVYCSFGHLYTANLLQFQETKTLGPLSEQETEAFTQLSDGALLSLVRQRLTATHWESAIPTIDRVYELRSGDAAVTPEDQLLSRSIHAWALITECSLHVPMDTAPPFDPRLARNRRLQRDYRAARHSAD
ncbi:MAG: hypothetical protein ACON5B_17145 [Myxococcota bacterium]